MGKFLNSLSKSESDRQTISKYDFEIDKSTLLKLTSLRSKSDIVRTLLGSSKELTDLMVYYIESSFLCDIFNHETQNRWPLLNNREDIYNFINEPGNREYVKKIRLSHLKMFLKRCSIFIRRYYKAMIKSMKESEWTRSKTEK